MTTSRILGLSRTYLSPSHWSSESELSPMRSLLVLAFFCLVPPLSVLGDRILIDDSDPSWRYDGPWNSINATRPCPLCHSQPDPDRALRGTWHDSGSDTTATAILTFTGVSIYLYVINPPEINSTWSFKLDSTFDGRFVAPLRTGAGRYAYNYLAYARNNLTQGNHTVEIANHPPGYLLLDYAIYDSGVTTSCPTSTPSHPVTSGCRLSVNTAIRACGIIVAMSLLANVLL